MSGEKECIKSCSEIYRLSQQASAALNQQYNNYKFVIENRNKQLQTANEENEKLKATEDEVYQTLDEQVRSCLDYPDSLDDDLSISELLGENQKTLDAYAKDITKLEQENKQLEDIATDFLLDATDDDGFTIPIVKQIYDALDAKDQDIETLTQQNTQLREALEKSLDNFEMCLIWTSLPKIVKENINNKYIPQIQQALGGE